MASNVDMKLLKQTKFPPEFNQKVDMRKVNLEVMKRQVSSFFLATAASRTLDSALTFPFYPDRRWIAGKISEILGNEDDVVIELCFGLLEGSQFVSSWI